MRPILFSIIDLGLRPRIALESLDSGSARLDKIATLVRDSQYGIHDLSRLQASAAGEYYRLNMPFELGLDVGCRLFGQGRLKDKRCLILETEPYRYRASLSDISGCDIAAHGAEPIRALKEVRNWLSNEKQLRSPGPEAVWGRYSDFMADNYDLLKARGYSDMDIQALPVAELIREMLHWVTRNPTHRK